MRVHFCIFSFNLIRYISFLRFYNNCLVLRMNRVRLKRVQMNVNLTVFQVEKKYHLPLLGSRCELQFTNDL